MKNQKIYLYKLNQNKKFRIKNVNNLNNNSYINNYYNYYCQNNHSLKYIPNNKVNNNLNFSQNNINQYKILNQKKSQKNSIYSSYLKKQLKKIENKKFPVRINYPNENINLENIFDTEPICENINIFPSHRDFNSLNKIDYYNCYEKNYNNNLFTPERYQIPIPKTKITQSKRNKLYSEKARNTDNNIYKSFNHNNLIIIDHYDTDRTLSKNFTLNGINTVEKNYKNKKYKNEISKNIDNKKINKNIIQKSLNLIFCSESKNKKQKKIISFNEKKIKIFLKMEIAKIEIII